MNVNLRKFLIKILQNYPQKHTSGLKKGIPFSVHFANVGLIAYQISEILRKIGYFNLEDSHTVFIAAVIHDMNKITNTSMRTAAIRENIIKVLKENFSENEDFWKDKIDTIQSIIPLHSVDNPVGSKLYISQKEKVMAKIIQFSDTFDLLDTANLEYDHNIYKKLLNILEELNYYVPEFKYKYLVYHYFNDYRGVLTNYITDEIINKFETTVLAVPIARFNDGVVYLCNKEKYTPELLFEDIIIETPRKVFHKIFSLEYTLQKKGNEIYIREGIFNFPLNDALTHIISVVNDLKIPNKNEVLKKITEDYLKKYFGNKTKKTMEIYEEFDLIFNSTKEIETIKEKLINLIKKYKTQRKIKNTYIDELKKYIETRLHLSNLQKNNSSIFTINKYGKKPKEVCSICGSEFEVSEAMSAELPRGIKPQLFSNILPANKTMDPKRNICSICKLQFIANKNKNYSANEKNVYYVLIPYNYFPNELIHEIQEEYKSIKSNSTKENKSKDYENILSMLGIESNTIEDGLFDYTNINIPIINPIRYKNSKKYSETVFIAYAKALYIQKNFPVKILITGYPQLLDEDIRFSEEILIQDLSFKLKKTSSKRILKLYEIFRNNPKNFFANKNNYFYKISTSEPLTAFSTYITKVFETKKDKKVILNIFEALFGGEKMEYAKKISEFILKQQENIFNASKHQIVKYFDVCKEVLKKFEPQIESEEDLKAQLFSRIENLVNKPIKKEEIMNYIDNFVEFVKELENKNLDKGRKKLLLNWKKYRDLIYGYVWKIYFENKEAKKNG
ncbi:MULTISPECIES: hypothetical protein [unclassified Thermosipho (in: thermotogales)]|uniref:hypothetical protein n=1 Tax=unclassified Thermosipho (in: thermotogales) TaxID=2676525 RepID=UPI000985BF1C|nr:MULTISPECIES: hypothetical protein [unclassified Thermosipho (in: thermotogales)]MBT1247888.1 hypothetical protein [Thermosipho sp. 1244]OOC47413.1 hypothetical protein XO09_01530 [Thermosipho sp. 1223]